MIRDGATMIRGADDLLADLGYDRRPPVADGPPGLPDDERRVFEQLAGPSLPDALARAAGVSIPEAVSALIRLELRGLVRNVGGRYERRLPRGRPRRGRGRRRDACRPAGVRGGLNRPLGAGTTGSPAIVRVRRVARAT